MRELSQSELHAVHHGDRPLYLPLHRVTPVEPWPFDAQPKQPACTANACGGDSKRCPCPSACELPADGMQARLMTRIFDWLDRAPVRLIWLAYAPLAVVVVVGVTAWWLA